MKTQKELTFKQFAKIVKNSGKPVLAIRTEDWRNIPKNASLYYGVCPIAKESISSSDSATDSANRIFGYNFDYQWVDYWRDEYRGKFILIEEKKVTKVKVIKQIPTTIEYKGRLYDLRR